MTTKIPVELSSTPSIVDGGNATAITIDSSEKVGIGETSPLGKLHVKTADSGASADSGADELVLENSGDTGMTIMSGTSNSGSIRFGDSADNDNGIIIYNHGSSPYMRFFVDAAERMRIASDGKVGIGTTSPGTILHTRTSDATSNNNAGGGFYHISSSTAGTRRATLFLDADNGNFSTSSDGAYAYIEKRGDGGILNIINQDAADTAFQQGGSEKMRITSSGEVLIGTTGSGAAGALYINTSASNSSVGAVRLQTSDYQGSSDLSTTAISVVKSSNNTTTSQTFIRFGINSFSAGSGQINANGASQCAFGTFSDRTLKENITDLPTQLDKIKTLRPVEFDYIESQGGGHQLGFIAQEVEEIYPDMVGETEGKKTLAGLGKWEARLIKAIQEQQAIIEDLQTQINEVKNGN